MVDPVLKWAGGKRWLAKSEFFPIPSSYKRYVEPFLGSGAIFFKLAPENALLSDLNADLINLYAVLRDHPTRLWNMMQQHHQKHSQEYYYQVRGSVPKGQFEAAAKFLYLNRTCWNGLYRVNLKGQFNVPIGTKDTVVFEDDDFHEVSDILKGAEIVCSDFEKTVNKCGEGDFVFVDPPYTVKHNFNNFLKYNEKIFSWDDQVRLREAVGRAADRGANVVVTNADHELVRELYDDFGTYHQLDRQSVLAGDAEKRRATTEAMFVSP